MTRPEARWGVSTLLALGLAGLGGALFAPDAADRWFGAGIALLCLGLFLQHRARLNAALRGAASEPERGDARLLPQGLQWLGVVLLFAGIAVWVAGR